MQLQQRYRYMRPSCLKVQACYSALLSLDVYCVQNMLQAVDTIHEARIVHSDLKPANFLLVEGELKLIDFGIARALQSDTTNIVRETQVSFAKACLPGQ